MPAVFTSDSARFGRASFAALAVLALTAALSVLGGAAPASAHEQLLSSSPTASEQLPTTPSEVTVTFTDDLMDIGAVLLLRDAAGTEWELGDPVLAGASASASVEGELPDGSYTLAWRVVSGDGHPISGIVPFTVGEPTPASVPEGSATAEPGSAGTLDAATTDSTSLPDAAGEPAGMPQRLRILLLGAGGAALALALGWGVTRWVRHARQK